MEKLVAIVSRVPKAKPKKDDDFTDRMSHRYTVLILVTFAVVVSMTQYIGRPITCWAPKHFTGSHIKFATNYCWVKNTYYLPMEDEIPKENEDRHTIIYYQWVQFIMLFQAFLFYAPTIVWHGLNQKSGVDADDILKAAQTFQKAEKGDSRSRTLRFIVNNMHRFLTKPMAQPRGCVGRLRHCLSLPIRSIFGKGAGNYLVILYIISKLLFLANAIGQLFILNHILKTDYNIFGAQVIDSLLNEIPTWSNNATFPRVSMCDFKIRRLGNVQRYTLQCVLPINLYTERMYAFLWFWMVLLSVLTAFSTATWIIRALMRRDRLLFLKNHLRSSIRVDSDAEKKQLAEFLDYYLKQDGAFILRLISHNTNNITVTEIMCALYEHWRSSLKVQPTEVDLVDKGSGAYPSLAPMGHNFKSGSVELKQLLTPTAPGPPEYSEQKRSNEP